MIIGSPLEQFIINPLISISMIGVDLSITNSSLTMIIAIVLIITAYKLSIERGYIVPTRIQSVVEILYETVYGLIKDNIGEKGNAYFPFIFTLFTYIVVLNLMGMVPYVFSATAHISVALALSFGIWFGVTLRGFSLHGINFLSMFMPQGAPMALAPLLVMIELVSYSARAISLGVRLAANISAGHLLLAILSGFTWTMLAAGGILSLASVLPALVIFAMSGLELAVAVIQAYVFTLLTCIYINDAIHLH
uniref:ATP synthase subunit a n=1 Tax=Amoebidium parasiticum TaxID=4881 RepID=Q8M0B3_AMOPA|nr:ATP synthase F0 subunit 6 [Amoebidium parasiticum]